MKCCVAVPLRPVALRMSAVMGPWATPGPRQRSLGQSANGTRQRQFFISKGFLYHWSGRLLRLTESVSHICQVSFYLRVFVIIILWFEMPTCICIITSLFQFKSLWGRFLCVSASLPSPHLTPQTLVLSCLSVYFSVPLDVRVSHHLSCVVSSVPRTTAGRW